MIDLTCLPSRPRAGRPRCLAAPGTDASALELAHQISQPTTLPGQASLRHSGRPGIHRRPASSGVVTFVHVTRVADPQVAHGGDLNATRPASLYSLSSMTGW